MQIGTCPLVHLSPGCIGTRVRKRGGLVLVRTRLLGNRHVRRHLPQVFPIVWFATGYRQRLIILGRLSQVGGIYDWQPFLSVVHHLVVVPDFLALAGTILPE